MQDHGENPPNSCGFDELLNCRKELIKMEDLINQKSLELKYQIGYNSFTLIIGMIVGFLFAKMWKK